ncbi:hypothetical protein ACRAWD_20535 [Caulobacter segnis]
MAPRPEAGARRRGRLAQLLPADRPHHLLAVVARADLAVLQRARRARLIDALESRFPETTVFDRQAISLLIIGPVIFMLARTAPGRDLQDPAFRSEDPGGP